MLVVDDDESVRNAVALMAEVLGFTAITAADGDTIAARLSKPYRIQELAEVLRSVLEP